MGKMRIFISYASKDAETYHIKEIYEFLTKKENIQDVLNWKEDNYESIMDDVEKYIAECDIFLLFCSPNTLNSISVQKEYHVAENLNKAIIPIFINPEDIPTLLSPVLGSQFDIFDLQKSIEEINSLILKKREEQDEEERLKKEFGKIRNHQYEFQKLKPDEYFESLMIAINFLIKVKKTKSLLISDIAMRMGLNPLALKRLLEELIYDNRLRGKIVDIETPSNDDYLLKLSDDLDEDKIIIDGKFLLEEPDDPNWVALMFLGVTLVIIGIFLFPLLYVVQAGL